MSENNESLADEVMGDLQSEAVEGDLAVLTADLQRLQAEYVNYRKRVERDRALAHELAISARAREHDELQGGFKAVADQLISVTTRIGLQPFGEAGSSFNPQIHEALMHTISPEVTEPTATSILQPGYKYRDRILRAARVAVTDPE
jgi:molecular chaperone GrpE